MVLGWHLCAANVPESPRSSRGSLAPMNKHRGTTLNGSLATRVASFAKKASPILLFQNEVWPVGESPKSECIAKQHDRTDGDSVVKRVPPNIGRKAGLAPLMLHEFVF